MTWVHSLCVDIVFEALITHISQATGLFSLSVGVVERLQINVKIDITCADYACSAFSYILLRPRAHGDMFFSAPQRAHARFACSAHRRRHLSFGVVRAGARRSQDGGRRRGEGRRNAKAQRGARASSSQSPSSVFIVPNGGSETAGRGAKGQRSRGRRKEATEKPSRCGL